MNRNNAATVFWVFMAFAAVTAVNNWMMALACGLCAFIAVGGIQNE